MGKAIVTFVVTLIVGIFALVVGNEIFGGFPELGSIVSIATASGFIVFFQKKK